MTTTSGKLLDHSTGAPLRNSCVAWLPVGSAGTLYTNVHVDGTWSFTTDSDGPLNLAFYTTTSGNCADPIQASPVPSWYENQPLDGTDPNTITPPPGVTSVPAGTSGLQACLGSTYLPSTACANPTATLSGTAYTTGPTPLPDLCVAVLGPDGFLGAAGTDANGNWLVSGLPTNLDMVVAFLPNLSGGPDRLCDDGHAPADGDPQPVFYTNTWVDFSDQALFANPHGWAVEHGATVLRGSASNINGCITNAPGNVVPRPSCTPPASTTTTAAPAMVKPAATAELPATGPSLAHYVAIAAGLIGAGLLIRITARRKPGHH